MNREFQRLLLALLVSSSVLFGVSLAADSQLIVQWDNDLLTGSDRDYTNGARVAFLQELDRDTDTHNMLQQCLGYFIGVESGGMFRDRRFDAGEELRFSWGVGLTQLMFTPEDPSAFSAPEGQRPYAGWLGLELSLNVGSSDSSGSFTLSIGTTGENSLAQYTQEWVHENVSDSPIFQGWDSQVPGEMTVNLHFDCKQRLHFLDFTADWLIEFDGYYEWGAALGNFRTDAYVGSLFRFGYNLPAIYTTPRVQLGSYSDELFRDSEVDAGRVSLIGFFGFRGYGVLHDITLDGPVFRDFDSGVESEPWVGEMVTGVGVQIRPIELTVAHTFRTNEFSGQTESLEFGSVLFRASMPF